VNSTWETSGNKYKSTKCCFDIQQREREREREREKRFDSNIFAEA
jgi:hypothetical protein